MKRRLTVTIKEIRLFISGIIFIRGVANTTSGEIEPSAQSKENIMNHKKKKIKES